MIGVSSLVSFQSRVNYHFRPTDFQLVVVGPVVSFVQSPIVLRRSCRYADALVFQNYGVFFEVFCSEKPALHDTARTYSEALLLFFQLVVG